MARQGDVDYVGTEDYDALLLGAPLTLPPDYEQRGSRTDGLSGDPGRPRYHLGTKPSTPPSSWGTDFNAGIDGIGPKTAVKLVTEHGDLWGALEARDAHVDHAERSGTCS